MPHLNSSYGRAILLLLVVLALVSAVRLRLLDIPLERDEGEYAYAGQLMLQGVPPYLEAYNMKWPGTYAAYAVMMALFGQTQAGIHFGLILVNLLSAVFIFILGRRMIEDFGAAIAAGTYAFLTLNPFITGIAAHATHFVVLFALAGLVLLKDPDRISIQRIFWAGFLIGLSALMKQAGAAFGIFAAVWLVKCICSGKDWHWRSLLSRTGWLALGGLLPFLIMLGLLGSLGVLKPFKFWTIQYAAAYASIVSPREALSHLLETASQLFQGSPLLWLMVGLGGLALFFEPFLKPSRFYLFSLALLSFIAVCPGGYFRGHYFLLLAPAAGLWAGAASTAIAERSRRHSGPSGAIAIPVAVFAIASAQMLIKWRSIYFEVSPSMVSRLIYRENPFPEAVEIARYIAAHCPPDAKIAVIGSEPEIYFYARRRGATGYLYTYPLMEDQPYAEQMQKEMIAEIEHSHPQYVVYIGIAASWLAQPHSPSEIFSWFERYRKEMLVPVGLIEIVSLTETKFQWSESETLPHPSSDLWISLFKRKSDAPR